MTEVPPMRASSSGGPHSETGSEPAWTRYLPVFNDVEQGFCVVEMLFDASGRPVDYRFLAVNPSFEREGGVSNAVGRTVRELLPDVEPRWIETYGGVALTGKPVHFRDSSSANGRTFDVNAFKLPEAGPFEVAVLFRDVTAKVKADEALREERARLQLAMSIAAAGTWDLDLRTNQLHWSESHFRLLGYEPTTSLQASVKMLEDALLPEDKERVMAEWRRAESERDTFRSEHRFRRADNTVMWVTAAGRFFYDHSGHATRFIGIFVDTTLRRQAEEALRLADRRKDEFIATLAHELRNPLAPLSTALTVLRFGEPDPDTRERMLDIAGRQARQLARLVDDLMEVSRIAEGRLVLRKELVDMGGLVATCVELVQTRAEAAGQSLAMTLPASPLCLAVDPARMAQVVSNLLSNAMKYTPYGGGVHLRLESDGSRAHLVVSDTGIGIPRDMLERIFDLFTQVDHTLGRAHGGLGIGLALVRQLVALHGGTVSASSDGVGQGSTFRVTLPMPSEQDAPKDGTVDSEPPAAPPEDTAASLRVLVVDDNVDAAESMAALLQDMGCQAKAVYSGADCLRIVDDYAPDWILLDVGMPGMTGVEVAQQLATRPSIKRARLAALTGWADHAIREETSRVGFEAHLVKPVSLHQLVDLLLTPP